MKRKRIEKPWTSFESAEPGPTYTPAPGETIWINSRYQVYLRHIPSTDGTTECVHLSIKRLDRDVIHDWRDLQRIKNELAGAEWEGIELYPAESRLVDTANQYHLWCFPRLEIGFDMGRLVSEATFEKSRQRPWDADARPTDLISQERVDQLTQEYLKRRKS